MKITLKELWVNITGINKFCTDHTTNHCLCMRIGTRLQQLFYYICVSILAGTVQRCEAILYVDKCGIHMERKSNLTIFSPRNSAEDTFDHMCTRLQEITDVTSTANNVVLNAYLSTTTSVTLVDSEPITLLGR